MSHEPCQQLSHRWGTAGSLLAHTSLAADQMCAYLVMSCSSLKADQATGALSTLKTLSKRCGLPDRGRLHWLDGAWLQAHPAVVRACRGHLGGLYQLAAIRPEGQ